MKNQKYRHCTRHNGQFTFQLAYLGQPLRPNEHWDTEEDAACAADLTKHYFRENFFLDLPASLDPEVFNEMANRLSVVLSDCLSVRAALPPGVIAFLLKHRDILATQAENGRPEVKPWTVLRKHLQFYSNGELHDWVLSCERAEIDCEAFAALNGKYFLSLMDGISNRSADILKPLGLALKMHSGVTNDRLLERVRLLVELSEHLRATHSHIAFLAIQFAEEQHAVGVEMARLASNRPNLS